MEALINVLTWPRVVGTVTAYLSSLVIYRLFFHPLARFPGPRLAAITRLYEGYYDLYQNGQYTFKIAELHKQYGPIIRISPFELHVSDPAFFDTLYRQDGVWHKYDWAVDAFAAHGATLFTADHHLHKARRQPLNPFFSKARVVSHLGLIQRHVEKLCARLSELAKSKMTFDLGAATTAVSRDIANEFIIGKHYNSLGKEDFDVAQVIASQGGGKMWRTTKFVRWFAPALRLIPPEWVMAAISDPAMKEFFQYILTGMKDTRDLIRAAESSTSDDKPTIVHQIVRSGLSRSEKSFDRVFEDVSTVTGAGFETTASVLRLVLFSLYSNVDILERVRTELASAAESQASGDLELTTLQQLPYLTACVMEGLRLSPAIATRMARVAPDRDLFYGDQRIPAGTPVGMTSILLHTDEKYYSEPNRFNPDRWMDPDPWKIGDKLFVPFSKGTRMCLGMHLAWADMYLITSTIVRRFDFQFPSAKAGDFLCTSDQFAVGTSGKGELIATATVASG
ncbi:related to cytochrome P450 CYP3/CYP5/CYP6/CYP9 subfamilies [Cephalotrichum gorgonifer]|uniref:Related to cytochrome P450 CYP3/CYP5/CYP6/CYP9 subfamilies n=1 Tax=Cephalotrichum gorgonifer TaxID=2041049 RepID=A0AAE8SXB5_9PEZI|nr:related to cytochrome P450 CYP3/CYP5/CYP6/CYP9 subfamilies [Cephalotrichum gorgonifer]